MNKLKLTPAASLTQNEHGILLQSDLGAFQLHGRDISAFIDNVLPLLKGQYDQQQICEQLSDYDDASIAALLTLLIDKGLVEEVTGNSSQTGGGPYWQTQVRFLKAFNTQGATEKTLLLGKKVLVVGLEPWAMSAVAELAHSGVGKIHLLDNWQVSEEDLLCIRALTSKHVGTPRRQVYENVIQDESPWCNISSAKLEVNEKGHLKVFNSHQWDLVIITLPKDEQYWLKATASYIQHTGFSALYGALDGIESWIGPLVEKGSTACWNCMRLRQLGNSDIPTAAHDIDKDSLKAGRSRRARSLVAPLASVTGSQLAMESIKVLTQFTQSKLHSAVQVNDLIKGENKQHKIIPMPWCEICGGPDGLEKKELFTPEWAREKKTVEQYAAMSAVGSVLERQPINPLNLVTSTEMVHELFIGWVDEKFGVIKTLKSHSSQLPPLPITASAYVSAFTEGKFDRRTMGQVGAGKGLDSISAHIGAVGEALERYSAARYRKNKMLYSSIDKLEGDFINPTDLVLYSKAQYRDPNFIFSAWNKKRQIHWAKGVWIGTETPVWVPSLVTYFNFDCAKKELFSQASSNGLAAGQNFNDAAMRATYELIERDAMMLTWYAQVPPQRLSLQSVTDPKLHEVMENITRYGVSLELYLIDMGTKIPTVVCLGFGDGVHNPATSVSLATHVDINVALRKAILEQGHVLPYLRSLMGNQHTWPMHVQQVLSLEDHAKYYFSKDKQQYFDFMRQPENQAILASDWQGAEVNNIYDLQRCLEQAELQVAVVDVTSPDMQLSPFSVVRAVGPHIQPIHFGEQFKRVDNPRLKKLLNGRAVNMQPHPIA